MPTVFANSRSIVHKGDGQTNTAAIPDVCKTPSPGGPVPIPYPNIAMTSDLAKGTKKVKIEGNPAANQGSNLSTSSGDEAGTAGGGIVSSKTKGKLTWGTCSSDVKFEGKGVARFSDVTQHNGNSFNTAFTEMGGTGMAYGDDFEGKCPLCNKDADKHRILEIKESSAKKAAEILKELKKDPSKHAKKGRGYMVGVLVCNCQTWATTSGKTPSTFASAASGCTIVPGGAVSPADLAGGDAGALSRLNGAFEAVEKAKAANKEGYSYPGACAGTKLMKAASGHEMLSMTEVFFQPEGVWEKSYDVLQTVGGVTAKKPMKFSSASNKAVASCHSCQLIIPFTLCKLEDWKC